MIIIINEGILPKNNNKGGKMKKRKKTRRRNIFAKEENLIWEFI
jgi:hypothetical protein